MASFTKSALPIRAPWKHWSDILDDSPLDPPPEWLKDVSHSARPGLNSGVLPQDWPCPHSSQSFQPPHSIPDSHKACALPSSPVHPRLHPHSDHSGPLHYTRKSQITLASKLTADHVTSQLETLQWLKKYSPTLQSTILPYLQQHQTSASGSMVSPATPQNTCSLGLCSRRGNLLSVPQTHTLPLPQGPCTCCFFFCKLSYSLASSSLRILQVSIHTSDYLPWPPISPGSCHSLPSDALSNPWRSFSRNTGNSI